MAIPSSKGVTQVSKPANNGAKADKREIEFLNDHMVMEVREWKDGRGVKHGVHYHYSPHTNDLYVTISEADNSVDPSSPNGYIVAGRPMTRQEKDEFAKVAAKTQPKSESQKKGLEMLKQALKKPFNDVNVYFQGQDYVITMEKKDGYQYVFSRSANKYFVLNPDARKEKMTKEQLADFVLVVSLQLPAVNAAQAETRQALIKKNPL